MSIWQKLRCALSGDGGAERARPHRNDRLPRCRSITLEPLEDRRLLSATDVFVKDTQTGAIAILSLSESGAQADQFSLYPEISESGQYVSFTSYGTNLVPGDTNDTRDVFVAPNPLAPPGGMHSVVVSAGEVTSNVNFGNFDVSAPTADLLDVVPDPRPTAIDEITIVFSEAVVNVDHTDFTLTQDGAAVSLTAANVPATADGGVTWVMPGLTGLTDTAGVYVLTLTASSSGIVDLSGNALEDDASDQWEMDPSARISGQKWHDLDSNGLWDSGEPALPNWEIYLDLNDNGRWDTGEPLETTDAEGRYTFTELDAGTYVVAELLQDAWDQTFPALDVPSAPPASTSGSLSLWDVMLAEVGDEAVVEKTIEPDGTEIWSATWSPRPLPEAALAILQNTIPTPAATSTFVSIDHAPEGDLPREIAFTPDGSEVLVVHRDTDNVTIFNAVTRQAEATVGVGDAPVHIAVTPDGSYALTPNLVDGTVSVIDLATRTVTTTIPLSGAQPFRVEITSDGNHAVVALAGDGSGASFSVIDLTTLTEVRNFASARQGIRGSFTNVGRGTGGNNYSSFRISPDNSTIVLPGEYDDQVIFYDLTTGTELSVLDVAYRPVSVDISADGSLAVVGHFLGDISVIDPVARTLVRTFNVGEFLQGTIRITPDKAYALVTIANSISFVRLSDGAKTASYYTGTVGDIEFSHDGKYAFIASNDAVVIDVASQTIAKTLDLGFNSEAAVSPVSYEAAAIDLARTEDVYFYNINGASGAILASVPSGEAPEGDAAESLAVSPDGQTLVTGNLLSGNVSFINLTTQAVTGYTTTGTRIADVAVTPNGTHAVVANQGSDTVSIIDMATGTEVANLSVPNQPTQVAISPDSQWAYVISIMGTSAVHFIRLDGANSTVEGSLATGQTFGAWLYAFHYSSGIVASDDGATLAICVSVDDELMLVDATTRTEMARIALPSGSLPMHAAFSPDASRLYVANDDGFSISVIDVNGAASSLLTTIPVGGIPRSVHVDALGEYVYVPTNQSTVEVIDGAANTIVRTAPIATGIAQEAWLSRETSVLYVASYDSGVSTVSRVSAAGPSTALVDFEPLVARPSALVFSESLQAVVVAEPALDGVELFTFDELVRPGTHRVTVTQGEALADVNFGNHAQPGTIQGSLWNDLDGNRLWDQPSEPVLTGWTVYLDSNANDQFDAGVDPSTVTDAQGSYSFGDLDAGTYVVAIVPLSDWEQTFPDPAVSNLHQVTLDWGELASGIDFGNRVSPGEIRGYKWNDLDNDGIWDQPAEPALEGWTIYLDINRNGLFDQDAEPFRVTGADGSYVFTDLAPDTYLVGEVQQYNWQQTYPAGAADSSSAAPLSAESATAPAADFHTIPASGLGASDGTLESTLADAFLVPDEIFLEMAALNAAQILASPSPTGERPFGADPDDTSEFMLGDVWVTVVLLESDGSVDSDTEDWTATEINNVKTEIQEGLQWWEDTLQAAPTVSPLHHLEFHIDFTHADTPVATGYEPINRPYTDQSLWIDDFLGDVGYASTSSYFTDMSRWNDDQRIANSNHWSYTVFVVDSSSDSDNKFTDGHFAYAYLGGPFTVMTYGNNGWGISRMGQVLAHETGHIFYALDEYPDASTYTAHSGYYNTQNLNAIDGHPDPSSRVASIMAEATLQNAAYPAHTSSPTSLEMLGWKDSDADGVFDVLDVPLTLTGSGGYNSSVGEYQFSGTSSVQTLPNLNPQSSAGAININTVDQIEYRLDGGPWTGGLTYGVYSAGVALSVPASDDLHQIDIRTISLETGVTSNLFSDTFGSGVPGMHTVTLFPGQAVENINFGNFSASSPPTLSIDDVTVNEADGTAQFTVSLSAASSLDVTFSFGTANDTAIAGADYTATSDSGTITAGGISTTITVPILQDTSDEIGETYFVNLSSPVNATIADGQGLGTITDDDPTPTLSINDVAVDEAAGTATFTVSLSAASGLAVRFNFDTANDTATAGLDYTATSGAGSIATGDTSTTVTVAILQDTIVETDETYFVNLSSPVNATILDGQGLGTITDDDTAGFAVTESDGGTTVSETGTTDTFTVALTATPLTNVVVTVTSEDTGEAIVNVPSLTFTPTDWDTPQTVIVTGVDDAIVDGTQTSTVTLSIDDANSDDAFDGLLDQVVSVTVTEVVSADFGDAPLPYPTTLARNGAWHAPTGPTLGGQRDTESDGVPATAADGDDTDGNDDEDGVTFGTIQVGQLDATVTVNVQNAPSGARLDAWIDFNSDGSWGGPYEQVAHSVLVGAGDNTIAFDVPSWAVDGATYARFRLSTGGGLAPSGLAADGEVEDYLVTILPPQATRGAFLTAHAIADGCDRPSDIRSVDMDGDGDIDLVAALYGNEKVAWYENDGNEYFTAHAITKHARWVQSVFTADVDGDGDMDVLATADTSDRVEWYENDGSQGFTTHVISSSADGASDVFAADVDGDGDMDVLSASSNDDKIAWYENDGTATFTEHAISTTADGANGVVAVDMDGDGDMDVLSSSREDDRIAWYENDGSETFTTHTISATADAARAVHAADLDDDGDIDVLSASIEDDTIAWHENDGAENFTQHTITATADGAHSVFVTDVDSDGDQDVLSASWYDDTVAWYENDGVENFATHTITAANGAHSVFASDIDGDGHTDVLAAAFWDHEIAWLQNDGAENFSKHTAMTPARQAAAVYAADMDGDGDMDVLSANGEDDRVAWYENDGAERFAAHTITASADNVDAVLAMDVDGDGDMDALSASAGDDTIAWYENSSGTFTTHLITTTADGAYSIYGADVDGDGDMDVLAASYLDDTIAWHENDGSGSFAAHVVGTAGDGPFSVHGADVDGDGDIDVLAASSYDDRVVWYENDGNQNFSSHTITTAAASVRSIFTADLNGDGHLDVLSASIGDDKINWYENSGTASFTTHTIATANWDPTSVFAADMDGDGDVDVMAAALNGSKVYLYKNDGAANFTAHTINDTAGGAHGVFAADVDGDGDLDILSALLVDDSIFWYENLSPGFTVTETGGSSTVSESGTTDTFTVVLNAPPLTNVVINVTASDENEATVAPTSLTFTPGNWDTAQTVVVTGEDDSIVDGSQTSTVTLSIDDASSDDAFDPLADQTVTVTTTDDDEQSDTVNLSGTNLANTVVVTVGSTALETDHVVTIDGAEHRYDPATVTTINIDGLEGDDTITVSRPDGSNRLYSHADYVKLTGSAGNIQLRADSFETVSVNAAGSGRDYAFFYDGPEDDVLETTPEQVVLTRNDGSAEETTTTATGFQRAYVYATQGGTDTAQLTGSDTARNRFYGYADYSILTEARRSFYVYARGFDELTADSPSSVSTYAYLYDSPDVDSLNATPASATMSRAASWSTTTANNFARVYAYSTRGGADTATLTGSSTGGNQYRGYPTHTTLTDTARSFYHYARGFSTVTAVGSQTDTSTDRAYLYDSSGNDTFDEAFFDGAMYQGGSMTDTTGTYENLVHYFDLVYARSSDTGTTDTIAVDDEELLAYDLIRSGTWL